MKTARDQYKCEIQSLLGNILEIGNLLSIAIIVVGACIYLSTDGNRLVDYDVFLQDQHGYQLIPLILRNAGRLDGAAVIQIGILLLIMTPVLRVVFCVFSFIIERDYAFVLIGMLVLLIIFMSL